MAVEDRWRRLDAALARVRDAVNTADATAAPDAVAGALDALYDLWEAWRSARKATGADAHDTAVTGDPGGETTAALVCARGGKSHDGALIEFGEPTDTFSDTFYATFTAWRWGVYADARQGLRSEWYAQHVAGRELLEPFDVAMTWFRAQPEIARSS